MLGPIGCKRVRNHHIPQRCYVRHCAGRSKQKNRQVRSVHCRCSRQPNSPSSARGRLCSPPDIGHRTCTSQHKTRHIEHCNHTLSQCLACPGRDRLSRSKNLAHHIDAIAYCICHYNLTRAAAHPGESYRIINSQVLLWRDTAPCYI